MTTLKQKIIHHSTQKLAAIAGITLLAINTPTVIHAQTHTFPNLDNYIPVDVKKYATSSISGDMIYFSTPDNLLCGFEFGDSLLCIGKNIPDCPANSPLDDDSDQNSAKQQFMCQSVGYDYSQGNIIVFHRFLSPRPSCLFLNRKEPLPINHKITFKGKTCAVGPHDLTACTDGKHGFVLQPGNTWVF